MELPALDEVIRDLSELADRDVDPQLTFKEMGIDSLAAAEWLNTMQERLGIVLTDDQLVALAQLPVHEIYDRLRTDPATR